MSNIENLQHQGNRAPRGRRAPVALESKARLGCVIRAARSRRAALTLPVHVGSSTGPP